MKVLAQDIFKDFRDKIITPSYYPVQPLETLKARLTAVSLLQDTDLFVAKQAEAFILRTSTFKDADLSRLQQFSSQIQTWEAFEVCSSYTNIQGTFLEYKLSFTKFDKNKGSIHFHAQYETKNDVCYFVSQSTPLIRVIGDPVLHQPGLLFPQHPSHEEKTALAAQIEHAKSVLIQTGGAGIAANQCAKLERPYRFTIVGVFYDIQEHAAGVARRYPNAKFPQAIIMVNPVITAVSQEKQQFNHACLSVPCGNRCAVQSPMEMMVSYQDPTERMSVKNIKFSGIDAVVLWHELTHIVYGKTYMDVTFESLPLEDLLQFEKMLEGEIQSRLIAKGPNIPELTVPPFHFSVKISASGSPRLDKTELETVLPKMSEETLNGLFNQARVILKKKHTNEITKYLDSSSLFFAHKEAQRDRGESQDDSRYLMSKL